MSVSDARELEGEDLERYNELKKQKTHAQIEEKKKDEYEVHKKALDVLVNKDEETITKEVNHLGNEIKYILNMDRKQENLYSQIADLERKEEITKKDREKYKELVISFFGEIIVEFNGKKIKNAEFSGEDLAKYCYDEWGRIPFEEFIEEVLLRFYEEKKEKMDTVEKFR